MTMSSQSPSNPIPTACSALKISVKFSSAFKMSTKLRVQRYIMKTESRAAFESLYYNAKHNNTYNYFECVRKREGNRVKKHRYQSVGHPLANTVLARSGPSVLPLRTCLS